MKSILFLVWNPILCEIFCRLLGLVEKSKTSSKACLGCNLETIHIVRLQSRTTSPRADSAPVTNDLGGIHRPTQLELVNCVYSIAVCDSVMLFVDKGSDLGHLRLWYAQQDKRLWALCCQHFVLSFPNAIARFSYCSPCLTIRKLTAALSMGIDRILSRSSAALLYRPSTLDRILFPNLEPISFFREWLHFVTLRRSPLVTWDST